MEALAPLASLVGCEGTPLPLDADTRTALGVGRAVVEARVARGAGSLRALLLVVSPEPVLRDFLTQLAARLSMTAPHLLWIVIVTQPETAMVAIVAWEDGRRPPRVAALLADRRSLVDSDAETLRSLAATPQDRDTNSHQRWIEILGREAVSGRFYRALERSIGSIAASSAAASAETRRDLALLNTSRLLFLSFLEAKGWLNGEAAFLARQFDDCMSRGGRFHDRFLRPLFFGTLNTPVRQRAAAALRFGSIPFLNGGLFTTTDLERRHGNVAFSDEAYGALIADVLGQFRFTAREESVSWNEAAVDPELLGKAFESLMASPERRRTGAFYTPFALVKRVADAGLAEALSGESPDALRSITVLDPACGSGAFLVHMLERIADALIQHGDQRDPSAVRRRVLRRSIFGVDVNPTAVWLCELRLWLSVVIDSAETEAAGVTPLPNLDRNIRVGDALSGQSFDDVGAYVRRSPAVRRLQQRYTNATGPRKESLRRELDRAERRHAIAAIGAELDAITQSRRDLLSARRSHDLFGDRHAPSVDERALAIDLRRRAASLRSRRRRLERGGALPFAFPIQFAHVAADGGFRLIVGNPPWVRLHRIPVAQRTAFRRAFEVARAAAWMAGARPSGAGRGFAAQVDLSALFVERSVRLLAPGGVVALLLPVKLWQSLAGGGVRALLSNATHLRRVEDHSAAPTQFDAAVYPSVVVARRREHSSPVDKPPVELSVSRTQHLDDCWRTSASELALDDTVGAPWVLLPPDARRAFDILRVRGQALSESAFGRPLLGVKCGCNAAFVVKLVATHGNVASVVTTDGLDLILESEILRPLLRGEGLRRWHASDTGDRIIWTHDSGGNPISALPPLAAAWFARWRRTLQGRADARARTRWWELFRTESADGDHSRVIWADMGREPRASVLEPGNPAVPLNSCYCVRCPSLTDADALSTLLNGPLARAWLDAICEPARGGYRRYLGWSMSLLPLPADWLRALRTLGPIGERARAGHAPTDKVLLDAAADAYGVSRAAMSPLVDWWRR